MSAAQVMANSSTVQSRPSRLLAQPDQHHAGQPM